MSDPIDRIVKGAPPPDVSAEQLATTAKANAGSSNAPSIAAPIPPTSQSGVNLDPQDALPSSPPQIYLNLLILESSLRLQYISLRTRLRLHLILFTCLIAWIIGFTYLLFFRPREDGSGVGGSVYWIVETSEKLALCSGIVTLILFWVTGMYDRGVRWPRKFVSVTNRGLRGFNLKVVVVRGGFIQEVMGWLAVLDMGGWFREAKVNFQFVPRDIESSGGKEQHHWNAHAAKHGILEEDIAPGGDVIRVLLLPKPFSPDFREGWDTFRMGYWDHENTRRTQLRAAVRLRRTEVAKREGGLFWWTGWRGWRKVRFNPFSRQKTRRQLELDKLAIREKISHESLKQKKQQRRASILRDGTPAGTHSRSGSGSRQNSRTSTPDPDARPPPAVKDGHARRGSSASSASGRRSRKLLVAQEPSRLSATETLLYNERDLAVPEAVSKRNSSISAGSSDSREGGLETRQFDEGLRMQKIKKESMFIDGVQQQPEEDQYVPHE